MINFDSTEISYPRNGRDTASVITADPETTDAVDRREDLPRRAAEWQHLCAELTTAPRRPHRPSCKMWRIAERLVVTICSV